jgi:hypothetical protein
LRQLEHMIGFYEKIERSKEDFVENQINWNIYIFFV